MITAGLLFITNPYAVPANDDATKSISIITNYLTAAIIEGLEDRRKDKEEADAAGVSTEEEGDNIERNLASVGEGDADRERGRRPGGPGGRGGNRGGGGRPGGGGGNRPSAPRGAGGGRR